MNISLKKDGWHRKLQEFTFNDPPRFGSLCPYFWFTVFCFVGLPVTLVCKAVMSLYRLVGSGINWLDENICVPLYESQLLSLTNESLFKLWNSYEKYNSNHYNQDNYTKISKRKNRFWRYRSAWMKKYNATAEEFEKEVIDSLKKLEAKMKRQKEEDEKKEMERLDKAVERERKRKKMFVKIAEYTQWLAPIVMLAISVAAIYGLFALATWTSGVWKAIYWVYILKGIVVIFAVAVVVMLLILAVRLIVKCELTVPGGSHIGKSFSWVIKPFKYVGSTVIVAISSVFDFVITYIKAAKENYCPMIKWDD